MSKPLKAIQAYGPRLALGRTIQKDELVDLLSTRTSLNESEIGSVLNELRDAVIF